MFSRWRKQTQFFLCLFFSFFYPTMSTPVSIPSFCTWSNSWICLKWTINGHLCLLHQIYQAEMDQRLLLIKPLRLPHRNGLTCPCVYYTTVTALKWTKTLLFIKSKLPHWNGQTSICVYYRKVTALKCTNEHLCLLHQSYCTETDWRPLVFITPKLPH